MTGDYWNQSSLVEDTTTGDRHAVLIKANICTFHYVE